MHSVGAPAERPQGLIWVCTSNITSSFSISGVMKRAVKKQIDRKETMKTETVIKERLPQM